VDGIDKRWLFVSIEASQKMLAQLLVQAETIRLVDGVADHTGPTLRVLLAFFAEPLHDLTAEADGRVCG